MPLPALDGPGAGGPPALTADASGAYVVSWPAGRPVEFPIAAAFFLQLVEEANLGRRALEVLTDIAGALAKLAPPA